MSNIPIIKKSATGNMELLVNGRPFIILGGELRNSSAASMEKMEQIWPKAHSFGLNTLLVPLYWELTEPEEGVYDFTLLDRHIVSAREHGLKLVFLWFGTWKNATSCYVPTWIKSDLTRFPRLQLSRGMNSNAVSCFSPEACIADSRAFAKVMHRIKDIDHKYHTVLMVQVENEAGILGTGRDRSPAAEIEFMKPVPDRLCEYLENNRDSLSPFMKEIMSRSGKRSGGTWQDLFSNDAEEIFMAWHIAKYIDNVAMAGKKEYGLPLYTNAWLIHQGREKPGQYPSGGPVPKVLDIWKAAVQSLDFFAPDIYKKDFRSACDEYLLAGNPLFIPETNWDNRSASSVFYAIGRRGGIGFCPFAIDDILGATTHPLSETYKIISGMAGMIAEARSRSAIESFYQQENEEQWQLTLGGYKIFVKTRKKLEGQVIPAGGLIIYLGDGSFLIVGRNAFIEFATPDSCTSNIEFLSTEEISISNGKAILLKRLNGDETYHGKTVILDEVLNIYKVRLNTKSIPVQHQSAWEFID